MNLLYRLTVGSLGCIFGTICFGFAAVILPLMDLTVPVLTLHGFPNRRSVALWNLKTYGRWTGLFLLATFWFPTRDRLNAEIR